MADLFFETYPTLGPSDFSPFTIWACDGYANAIAIVEVMKIRIRVLLRLRMFLFLRISVDRISCCAKLAIIIHHYSSGNRKKEWLHCLFLL